MTTRRKGRHGGKQKAWRCQPTLGLGANRRAMRAAGSLNPGEGFGASRLLQALIANAGIVTAVAQ